MGALPSGAGSWGREEGGGEVADIKSNNSHPTCGQQHPQHPEARWDLVRV